MLRTLRTVLPLGIAATLVGCAAIKGVSNTNLYAELPRTGTFAVRLVSGDPVVGNKIERMLRYKLENLGYRFTEASPDFLVSFTYDTVPAGSVSSAYSVINRAPQTAYVWGNTVSLSPSYSTATTVVGSTRLYTKTIAVRISRASTGDKLWDGVVSETGWCNQLFVTAPQILSLMFDGFPREQTNVQRMVTDSDEGAKQLRTVFPSDTDWGCQRT
jgi:hypothetical protein